jgi:hypothetical protein
MRTFFTSRIVSAALLITLPAIAHAHPGHDDHDFTWDFSHLAAHPFATAGCVVVLAAFAGILWQVSQRKSKRVSRQ